MRLVKPGVPRDRPGEWSSAVGEFGLSPRFKTRRMRPWHKHKRGPAPVRPVDGRGLGCVADVADRAERRPAMGEHGLAEDNGGSASKSSCFSAEIRTLVSVAAGLSQDRGSGTHCLLQLSAVRSAEAAPAQEPEQFRTAGAGARPDLSHDPAVPLDLHNFTALGHTIKNTLAVAGQFCRRHNHGAKMPDSPVQTSHLRISPGHSDEAKTGVHSAIQLMPPRAGCARRR